MKKQFAYAQIAARVFQGLMALALIGGIVSVAIVSRGAVNPEHAGLLSKLSGLSEGGVLGLQLFSLLHYLFFALFFYQLARLFSSFGQGGRFSEHALRSSRLLGLYCIAYALLNGLEISMMASLFSTPIWASESTSRFLLLGFVAVLSLVFFLQYRAYGEALELQIENELTV